MKPNIDLTENRDFRKHRFSLEDFGKMLRRDLGMKYPWSFAKEYYTKYEKIFRNADSEEREYCLRCGIDLSKKHWHRYYNLCSECDDSFSEIKTRYPWGD
jgi:hypothetical protein